MITARHVKKAPETGAFRLINLLRETRYSLLLLASPSRFKMWTNIVTKLP
jgi:hypothetical protein